MPRTGNAYSASGAWMSHMGKVRKVNEDACLFASVFSGASTAAPMRASLDGGHWIIAVADGIGGHKAGAYASREVIAELSRCRDLSLDGLEALLEKTNHRLYEESRAKPELAGTGATVAGLLACDEGLFAFNVGDARVYRQIGGSIHLITRDDSVEQLLVNEGLLRTHDGVRPSGMHALTQSIGGSSEHVPVETHIYEIDLAKRPRFIISTDGLSDMISTREMERACVSALDSAAAVQSLFGAAMDAGGRDNITIAVADVEEIAR